MFPTFDPQAIIAAGAARSIMAKIYGGRWKIIETLGGGGQSDVFRVLDTTGEFQGEYALKRVRNPYAMGTKLSAVTNDSGSALVVKS